MHNLVHVLAEQEVRIIATERSQASPIGKGAVTRKIDTVNGFGGRIQ
jgi:hypothetical protein